MLLVWWRRLRLVLFCLPYYYIVSLPFSITSSDSLHSSPESTLSIYTSFSLPVSEFDALYDLYQSTEGDDWIWQQPYSEQGYPWNFTSPEQSNPCSTTIPWQGIECTSNCTTTPCNVMSISLSDYNLFGPLPSSISNFTQLQTLNLYDNGVTGSIPNTITTLSLLEILNLGNNLLIGSIPCNIGNMIHLHVIELSDNPLLTGPLPDTISNLTLLTILSIGHCHITGTIPLLYNKLINLIIMDLNDNILTGTLNHKLFNTNAISKLTYLNLATNQFTGTIPSTISTLTSLQQLLLFTNQFNGSIPASLGNLTQVTNFYLYENILTGSIAESMILTMYSLVDFDVLNNLLTGTLPSANTWSNCTQLTGLELGINFFSGTIPDNLGDIIPQLIQLDLDLNLLTGSIPDSLGNMINISGELSLYGNFLTGTLPITLGNLYLVEFILLDSNLLTGTIPNTYNFHNNTDLLFFWLNQNYFTGTIPNTLSGLTGIMSIQLNDNLFSGTIPSNWIFERINSIDFSNNMLTGSIPSNMFEYSTYSLTYVNFYSNSITGTIPETMTSSIFLEFLILSLNCFTGKLPSTLCSSEYLSEVILDGLHSSTSCLQHALPVILPHSGIIASNNVYGTIPICLFQQDSLQYLHLGGNSFSGSLPSDLPPLTTTLNQLVLSSNDLTGSIPDSIWKSSIIYLDLSLNRLQGTLPDYMLSHVTYNDDSIDNNDNITIKLHVNQLSGSIPSILHNLPSGNINILEGNMFSCNINRNNLPQHDPKYKDYNCGSDRTNYTLLTFACILGIMICCCWLIQSLRQSIILWCSSYSECDSNNTKRGRLDSMLTHIRNLVLRVLVYIWIVCILLYGILSISYSNYTESYIWAISAIYKSGELPAILMVVCLIGTVGIIAWTLYKWSITHEPVESINKADVPVNAGTWFHKILMSLVIVVNITVVMTINALYVSATRLNYTTDQLTAIALSISVFKVIWNYVLYNCGSLIGILCKSRKPDGIIDINDDAFVLTDGVLVSLCLFNNIIAPFLAEMFVSSDCLLYIISEAPSLTFSYFQFTCTNLAGGFSCNYQNSESQTPVIPAFHYSHQCSFALVSSYSYIFIMRYTISGLVEPLIIWMLRRSTRNRMQCNKWLSLPLLLLPPLWKLELTNTKLVGDDKSESNYDIDQPTLISTERYLFHPGGRLRQRFVANMVTDISMLVCFGTLFPPLAIIIGLSIYKDTVDVTLAIGRFNQMINCDGGIKVRDRLIKIRDAVFVELIAAEDEIVSGVWNGMWIASIIWAFVLFDALSSSVGNNNVSSVWIVVVMFCIPFGLSILIVKCKSKQFKSESLESSAVDSVENPLSLSTVEMRTSSVVIV